MTVPFIEQNDQTQARREHLEALRALVGNVYPNKFERSNVTETVSREDTISSVVEAFKKHEPQLAEGEKPAAEVLEQANAELNQIRVRVAGRIAAPPRVMGKAAFLHLSDGESRLQIYVRRQDITGVHNDADGGEVNGWELFGLLDHGDFIGVEGYLFITKTGELSVHAEKLQFLAKALLPMPDKMHGINDPEIRQRQRYADLIAGSLKLERDAGDLTPREVFKMRSKVLREIRRFLDEQGYIEVETPMLTPLATGAAAKPFKTHHNTLDIDLFARIAPELYLKRLTVGGFEKVYELNRNFRNEGISTRHNPEFTMLEYYWAYADVNAMMDLHEQMMRSVVLKVKGTLKVPYGIVFKSGSHERFSTPIIDFEPKFERLTMKTAIFKALRTWEPYSDQFTFDGEELGRGWLDDPARTNLLYDFISNRDRYRQQAASQLRKENRFTEEDLDEVDIDGLTDEKEQLVNRMSWELAVTAMEIGLGESSVDSAAQIVYLFEQLAEPHLIQPTFITDFPKPVSPLSKASPSDPSVAERFEYFVGGLESANGFSELNDPEEQYQRFKDQMVQRERGDEEAMVMDEDYIRALSYGMPPAAGIGVGIDRLVMLLANKHSIRDVILFPHMRPERKTAEEPD